MNDYVRFSYGLLGAYTERRSKQTRDLQRRLDRAQLPMRASAYLAALYTSALLAALGVAALVGLAMVALPGAPVLLKLVTPLVVGAFFGSIVILAGPVWLENQISEKTKDIDENLPHGINYMLALANAGMTPKQIWGTLAQAKIFGPLAVEAARVHRDLDLFSYDIVKALRLAQERTASPRFHEFLQGAISAFQSGVELNVFLRTKGSQYQHAEVERQLKSIDTMGVLAETFLVMVVAAPLFMIILLTVMSVNQGEDVLVWGFALSLVFIPIAQLIIGAMVKSMNPRVWT